MVQFFKGDVGGELEEKGIPIQAGADAEAFFQLPPDIIGTVAGEAGPNLAGRLVGGEKLRAAGAEVPEPGGQVADPPGQLPGRPGQLLRVIALGERGCKVDVLHRRVSIGMRMR